jgi:hypothetical protein
VIYIDSEGIGTLSSLVKSSGSWGISLANAFNVEKNAYATMADDDTIKIKVQGTDINLSTNLETTVALAQPVANVTLGKNSAETSASDSAVINFPEIDKEELLAANDTSASADIENSIENDASNASDIETSELLDSSATVTDSAIGEIIAEITPTSSSISEVLNLNELNEDDAASVTTINTTQPQIKASLPANTMVRIVIHSDTTIDQTVQTDANGEIILDIAALGEDLEPGEHTASYTYIDPTSGEEVTKTYSFTVAPMATRQLASVADLDMSNQMVSTPTPTPSPTKYPTPVPSIPYGSGNPYLSTTITPTVASATASTRSAVVATDSGKYSSGSVGTTIALLLGGIFFILAGFWSYSLATSFTKED